MHPGDEIDSWTLKGELGSGGNATVWEAEHSEHGRAALKVLKTRNRDSERFKRFRREIETMRGLDEHPGILPLIDASLPEDGQKWAWLAMPICTTLRDALADAEVTDIVEAFAEVADIMGDLAGHGIAHRDLKPENLYHAGDKALVGDFGLVDLPDADALTGPAGVRGPAHYVAWEVYNGPSDADQRPADVYALAKSLWVLLTGQRFPPPGRHDPEDRTVAIGTFTPHPLATRLDKIVAQATRSNPAERPSMSLFAQELRSILEEDQAALYATPEDPKVVRELRKLLEPAAADHAARQQTITRCREHARHADELTWPMQQRVRELHARTEIGSHLAEAATLGWRTLSDEVGRLEVVDGWRIGYLAFGRVENDWQLTGGTAGELLEDGTLRVLGVHAVILPLGNGYEVAFEMSEEAPVTSILAEQAVERTAKAVAANLGAALELWKDKLAS